MIPLQEARYRGFVFTHIASCAPCQACANADFWSVAQVGGRHMHIHHCIISDQHVYRIAGNSKLSHVHLPDEGRAVTLLQRLTRGNQIHAPTMCSRFVLRLMLL